MSISFKLDLTTVALSATSIAGIGAHNLLSASAAKNKENDSVASGKKCKKKPERPRCKAEKK